MPKLLILGGTPSINSFEGVGDGVTDNRALLQSLINDVSGNGGGIIRIPTGNYALTDYISVPASVWLVGAGKTSIISRIGTVTAAKGLITVTGSDVRITDLQIDGKISIPTTINYGTISTPEDAALTLNTSVWLNPGISRFKMNRVTVTHTGGYGVFIDVRTASSSDVSFLDCDFTDNRPHEFTDGTLTGGSWTGGIYVASDCRSSAPYFLNGLLVKDCHWSRNAGTCIWSHSLGFAVHHLMFLISDSSFEDCGLDAIQFGNVLGGGVTGCNFHRIGYTTASDSASPVPALVPNHAPVAIDTTGYASGVSHTNNTIISVNGEGIDLDGFRDGMVANNTIYIAPSSDERYTTDSISGYGIIVFGSLRQVTTGIQTGNSNQNGSAQNVSIIGNRISGMGQSAIVGAYAKFSQINGNEIFHPTTALGVPIELQGVSGSSPADEWMCHDNVVAGNSISYAGNNFYIVEAGSGGLCANNKISDNVRPQ